MKEQQVSNILNLQSNAILVTKLMKLRRNEANDEEIEQEEANQLEFSFCNSQSVKLFGFDFTKNPTTYEDESLAYNSLNELRFSHSG